MLTVTGTSVAVAAIVLAIWAFAFDNYDPVTQEWFDGFGRNLAWDTPGQGGTVKSPGILWEVIDTIAAITVFGIFAGMLALGRRLRQEERAPGSMHRRSIGVDDMQSG
jgi:hypothetical protein